MKKVFLLIAILSLCSPCFAADVYIAKDATGTGTGADWTNALTDFPDGWAGESYCAAGGATWTKGITYWVAGSDTAYSVSPCIRNTTGSGTITIKKATASAHGTDTGWSAAYGTKQAVIPRAWLSGSGVVDNITIDGSTGSGTSGYGFKFNSATADSLIRIGDNLTSPAGIRIKYCELAPSSITSDYEAIAGYLSTAAASTDSPNLMVQNCYMHDLGGLAIHPAAGNWFTIQDNIVERTGQYNNANHKEMVKDDGEAANVTIRRNIFRDWQGYSVTGGIILGCTGTGSAGQHNWYIYNNLFYYTSADYTGKTGGNRVIGGLSSCSTATVDSIFVYNNTFANINESGAANILTDFTGNQIANSEIKNNLFYNNTGLTALGMSGVTVSYGWYYGNTGYTEGAETGHVNGTGDPFVNSAAYNFALSASNGSAANLSGTFTTDFLGLTRSTWNFGAYEYITYPSASIGSGATMSIGAGATLTVH